MKNGSSRSLKTRVTLAEAVRRQLRKGGVRQADFAGRHALDAQAFRTQLNRNTFSASVLEAVATLFRCEVSQLSHQYMFGKMRFSSAGAISPLESFRIMVRRAIRFKAAVTLLDHARSLYDSMEDNRALAVTFSLGETPPECTSAGWEVLGPCMIKALQRGATFVYVSPTESEYGLLSTCMPEVFEARSPQLQHQYLLDRLRESEVSTDCRSRVILCDTSWCPFWAAGMIFQFYTLRDGRGDRDSALFGKFPSGEGDFLFTADAESKGACIAYLQYGCKTHPKMKDLSSVLAGLS